MEENDIVAWDLFVEGCSGATFFHRAGWKEVIEKSFGHNMFYLMAERNSKIVGVLPLGRIKSVFFGNALISTPFCVYGGVAATDEVAKMALEQAAANLADDLAVDYLEVRNTLPSNSSWPVKDMYVSFCKPIAESVDENMLAIPRKQRAMVRKAIKQELASESSEDIDEFHRIYSESVRNLGTPVFDKRYFKALKSVFQNACDILTVRRADGKAVAAVMSFYFRDQVLPYYGGGTSLARELSANDFMYWELMKRSCEAGIRVFDYGRSKLGSGSYSFKKNWGFEPKSLNYQYHLVKAKNIPNVSPINPKYRLMVNAWRRLTIGMANVLGPMISSKLG
ncbi:MAG: FemAB family PEP-CTERM system-associated protein [Gammaproteobacteria bacterium]|nr:FemAB family PEP-CTERM system-associated protein [Gammaproteobacteria bacterium]